MENIEKPKSEIIPLTTERTDFYADSVEWCPLSPYTGYLVCGTYQLDEAGKAGDCNQVRQGNIALYHLTPCQNTDTDFFLKKVGIMSTAGVLDMKWSPQYINESCTVGVAFSNGKFELFQIKSEEGVEGLTILCSQNLADGVNKLALSLDWSSWKHQSSTGVVVSDSSGALNYIQLRGEDLYLLNSWKAHNFEAWIAAFDYDNPQVIFSGGDDCCLKGWDLRSLSSSTFVSKRHTMGVTSIVKCPSNNLLATGSYDENICLWDIRQMKKPVSETSVNGGVWRLKWNPQNTDYLLSSSMHNGFHILHKDKNGFESEPVVLYDKHNSLAYGCDWCYIFGMIQNLTNEEAALALHLRNCNFNCIVASCSFYDNSLHVWGVKL